MILSTRSSTHRILALREVVRAEVGIRGSSGALISNHIRERILGGLIRRNSHGYDFYTVFAGTKTDNLLRVIWYGTSY